MTVDAKEPVGTLEIALAHAGRLLVDRPALAVRQAEEILLVIPDQADAMRLLARAQCELGEPGAAATTLKRLTGVAPKDPAAWRALGDVLHLTGETEAADAAHLQAIEVSVTDPELVSAAIALREQRLAVAEAILRARLKAVPTDVAAIRMLAEVAARLGRHDDAINLLERCLELSPGFHEARRAYAMLLQRHERVSDALTEVDRLLLVDPRDPGYGMLKASILARIGDSAATVAIYEDVLTRFPRQPKGWMSFGHALKTIGRRDDSIRAYRRAIDQAPQLGEVWWSLANLKTYGFTRDDVRAMRGQLARTDIAEDDRLHLYFALAKALEDGGRFAEAFENYEKGNDIRREQLRHSPDYTTDQGLRARQLFDRDFFERRKGGGSPARDPIFIVGLPRSGSTLVEQILASHSQVEGTMELPDIPSIVQRISGRKERDDPGVYPEVLADMSGGALRALGEEFLERAAIRRTTNRPLFIDKLPNNWVHVGFIQLILPNATIIDARRHPMGCCLSGYKQHFARGQSFTYDLDHIGRYYRDYVRLMAHFDAVLPGKVHRVIYERMVADTEGEVRRLLDHVGLPFEDGCLEFWTNDRAVRTASSEQVRQPIFGEAVDHWRNFEPWLDPLKQALGPVLDSYPDVPATFE